MAIHKHRYEAGNRDEWLALRESMSERIGGSQLGAINNNSAYSSFLEELRYDVGAAERPDISNKIAVMRGQFDEEFVAQLFERFSGKTVHRENCIYVNDAYPHLKASIDRKIANESAGLECKTCSDLLMRKFKADEFPVAYWDQSVSYLAVTELRDWYLAILTGNNEFRCFRLTRDQSVAARYALLRAKFGFRVDDGDADAAEWHREWEYLDAVYYVDDEEIAGCEYRAAYYVGKVQQVKKYIEAFDNNHPDATKLERLAHLENCIMQVVEPHDVKLDGSALDEQIDMLRPATLPETKVMLDPASVNGAAVKALVEERKRLMQMCKDYEEAPDQTARLERIAQIELDLSGRMDSVETMMLPGEDGYCWKMSFKPSAGRRSAKVDAVERYFAARGEEVPEGIITVSEGKRTLKITELKPKAAKRNAVPTAAA